MATEQQQYNEQQQQMIQKYNSDGVQRLICISRARQDGEKRMGMIDAAGLSVILHSVIMDSENLKFSDSFGCALLWLSE